MELSEKLGQLRREKNLPRPRLAEMLGVSTDTVMAWEAGTQVPSKEQLKALSKLYGLPLKHLTGGELPEEKPEKSYDPKKRAILLWTCFGIWAAAILGLVIIFIVQNFF